MRTLRLYRERDEGKERWDISKVINVIGLVLLACIVASPAQGETVYFLVGEIVPSDNDCYVLALDNPPDIAHARDLIEYGIGIGESIVVATIERLPPGTRSTINHSCAPGSPGWSWEVSFNHFADIAAEICDGWPTWVEECPSCWPSGSTICFWSYTVVAELETDIEPPECDLTGDKFVNFEDLAVLASQWLQAPLTPSADIAPSPFGDGIVNLLDLAALTDSWMDCFVTQATSPNPSDNAAGIPVNPVLGWSAGDGALSHDVYLGTDADAVAEANQLSVEFMNTVSQTSFAPSSLAFSTKYYWRIDEIGPLCMAQGTVWSFTTVPPPPEQATNPGPADLATNVSVIADLGWTAGSGAASHDVYFGTSSPGNFQRNQTATTFDPGTLDSNITYYWRIDEKNAGGTTTGTVWSFTTEFILPGQATNPSPADLATDVGVIADLGWTAGFGAISHDVYFGTFSPGNFQRNQTATTFDLGTLDRNTAYYWRIDEKNASGTTAGNVWSFTTIADPNFVSWWKLEEISGTIAHDSAGTNNGTVYGAAWTTGQIDGALSFDGASDYVLVGDKDNLEPQSLTLIFWARLNNPSGSLQGGIAKGRIFGDATMYSYKFDFSGGNAGAAVTNTSDVGFGVGAAIGDTDWHMWAMTAGNSSLSIYKDGVVQNTAGYTGTIDYTKRYNSFVIGARENGNYSFNGKIDDVRFYSRALSASEIQQLYPERFTLIEVPVFNPAGK